MNYHTRYTKDDKYYHQTKNTSYIKFWLWGIVLVSILIIIIQLIYNNDASGPKCKSLKDTADYLHIKKITPLHPIPIEQLGIVNLPRPLIHFE